MLAETAQHAGHADIIRETIDGHAGGDHEDIGYAPWRAAHLARIQDAADAYRP